MRDAQRLNELYRKFVISEELPESELAKLTLEELSFLHASCEGAKKDEKYKNIHYPIRQQILYWEAVRVFKEADVIYLAQTKTPSYPYLDPKGNVWVFSDAEIARRVCGDLYRKQQVELLIRKVEKQMLRPMLAQTYFMGVENIVVDNGLHPLVLKRSDLMPEQKEANGEQPKDFRNADQQRSMIQFYQYLSFVTSLKAAREKEGITPEQKKDIEGKLVQARETLRLLEARMISKVLDAKFLVPMVMVQDGKNLLPGQTPEPGKAFSRKIANVTDSKQVNWMPAFSDWTEFSRLYQTKEWGAAIMGYEEMVKLAKELKVNRLIINPNGCAFRVDEKNEGVIEAFRKKRAELEASKKNS